MFRGGRVRRSNGGVMDIYEQISEKIPMPERRKPRGLTTGDYLRIASAGLDILGAFGGGREAAAIGEFEATGAAARAALESQLRQQGFQDAVARRNQDLANRQGLGTFQSTLGAQQRQLEQARLAADQEQAREAAFGDYTRLGLVGPQLASVIGGFPAATQVQSTPPPSTTQQLLGLGIGAAGLGGAVKGLFS